MKRLDMKNVVKDYSKRHRKALKKEKIVIPLRINQPELSSTFVVTHHFYYEEP